MPTDERRGVGVQQLTKSTRDGRPLAVRVYEQLRDLIVDGEVAADAQLVQEQVAESLGVSRTPVRDALNRLAHEGLVTWVPGSGYIVNGLTEQDIVEVYQVRLNLELLATRLSTGRHDAACLSRLNTLIEEMAAADPDDSARQFELNRSFHRALVEPCENGLLLKMLDSLWDHPVNRRITRSYVHDPGNVNLMTQEHREILEAARAADLDRLLKLSEHHMSTGYREAVDAAAGAGAAETSSAAEETPA